MKRQAKFDSDLPYLLYLPHDIDPLSPLPLILFLHGRGERGTDLQAVSKWGVPKYLDAGHDLNAIVLAPQNPETNENWVPVADTVMALVDKIDAGYGISQTHITGFSMGGHGTQYLAVNHPDRFATVSPVATYMYPSDDVTDSVGVLKDKPIWIFHSEADFVPVMMSDKVVETLNACGAKNITYTRLSDEDHTQTADYAYMQDDLYRWMLK